MDKTQAITALAQVTAYLQTLQAGGTTTPDPAVVVPPADVPVVPAANPAPPKETVGWHKDWRFPNPANGSQHNFNWLMTTWGSSWALAYAAFSAANVSDQLKAVYGGADVAVVVNIMRASGTPSQYGVPAGFVIPASVNIRPGNQVTFPGFPPGPAYATLFAGNPKASIPLPWPDAS